MLSIHAHLNCPLLRVRRLRRRRVDVLALLEEAETKHAAGEPLPVIVAALGGSVPYSYGYPSQAESCVIVLVEPAVAILFGGRLPACHATLAGAAVAATRIRLVRCLYDGRYSLEGQKIRARAELLHAADRAHIRFRTTGQ